MQSAEPWWTENIRQHPFQTASITTLTIGGVFMLVFFCYLGEMPEVSLANSTSILAAIALTGMLVFIVIGIIPVGYGIFLRQLTPKDGFHRTPWAMLVSVLPAMLTVIAILFAYDRLPENSAASILLSIYGVASLLLSIGCTLIHYMKRGNGILNKLFLKDCFIFSAQTLGWIYVCIIALQAFSGYYKAPDKEVIKASVSCIAWTFICCSISVGVARSRKNIRLMEASAFAGGLAAIFVMLTNSLTGIVSSAIRVTGLGEVPVRLVVTDHGCNILNKVIPNGPVCRTNKEENSSIVCPVMLRSKIGTPYVIELLPFDENGGWKNHPPQSTATIPKEQVLSWSRIHFMKNQDIKKQKEPASNTFVSHLNPSSHSERQRNWLKSQCGEQ